MKEPPSATTTITPSEEKPLGLQLFEGFERLGKRRLLTMALKPDQIQKLKVSDRQGVIEVFSRADYDAIQHLKRDSPQELLEYLSNRLVQEEKHLLALPLFSSLLIRVWLFLTKRSCP